MNREGASEIYRIMLERESEKAAATCSVREQIVLTKKLQI